MPGRVAAGGVSNSGPLRPCFLCGGSPFPLLQPAVSVGGVALQLLFDAQQAVVLGQPVGA